MSIVTEMTSISYHVNLQSALCVLIVGFDVRPLFSCSIHGKLLHHCGCGPPEVQEWQSEIKTIVTAMKYIVNVFL